MKFIKVLILMLVFPFLGINAQTNVSADDFAVEVKKDNIQIVDVRTPREFTQGHIEGAININIYDKQFASIVTSKLDKSKKVAVYCRSGSRSRKAMSILTREGYNVVNLNRGLMAWQWAGKSLVK